MEFISTEWVGAERDPNGVFVGGHHRKVIYRLCFIASNDVKESDKVFPLGSAEEKALREMYEGNAAIVSLSDDDLRDRFEGKDWTMEQIAEGRAEIARQVKEWGPTADRTVAVRRLIEVVSGLVAV